MNISLTPLDEAWKIPKLKKPKNMNKFSKETVQKDFLQNANQEITNSEPTGNDIQKSNYQVVDVVDLQPQPQKETIQIDIDDTNIISLLKPYNIDYIKKIVYDGIKLVLQKPKQANVEKFVGKPITATSVTSEDSTAIYILIALLVLDIIFKF